MNHDKKPDDYFIGYSVSAKVSRRALLKIAPVSVIGFSGLAATLAIAQRDPGNGVYESDISVLTGKIELSPYPMLRMTAIDGTILSMSIVSEGKCGAEDVTRQFDGKNVEITGFIIRRGKYAMIEQLAIASKQTDGVLPQSVSEDLGPSDLFGKIIDLKCFYGAMRPGEGLTHKQCAKLCIQGGIPATLLVADNQRNFVPYFLLNEQGQRVQETIVNYAEEYVRIRGQIEKRDNYKYIRFGNNDISRA